VSVRRRRLPVSPQWAVSIAAALAVIGFVGYAQWNGSPERVQFATSVQQVLAEQVTTLEAEQEDLRVQLAAAEAQVLDFQTASTTSSSALAEVNRRLEAARLAVGLTPLRGPGVVIEISDSKRVIPEGENPANYIVLVDDLRDIVVALWASGLVNTAFLSPPFRIEAIGSEGLLDRFDANPAFKGRVAQRIEVFGLEYASQAADSLELAAFVGNTRFRWAVPTEGVP